MTSLVPRSVQVVWATLVAITAVSWWTNADSGLDRRVAGAAILAFAFAKTWLVAIHFMDLRAAPAGLRRTVEAILACSCAGLIGWFLLA
ncbi:hypothetical protein DSM112329_03665 [Paraconexibacter sp. AEG42_29]|uniref:Prokaryotic cytochrome C oxidase subunit IV family protein n=1 Tax=Paraconexibacter sp. AEG42_29 TaxID=2997339 RepID=A0AAU7AYK1_9ACTN